MPVSLSLPTLDWIALVLCLFFAVRGAFKGFAWQAIRTVGIVTAVWAAFAFQVPVAAWIHERLPFVPDPTEALVASLGIMLGIFILTTWIAWMVRGFVKEIRLGGLDRVMGFVLGALMGLLILTFGFFVWGQIMPNNEKIASALDGSYAGTAMAWLTEQIRPLLSQDVIDKWDDVLKYLENAKPALPG